MKSVYTAVFLVFVAVLAIGVTGQVWKTYEVTGFEFNSSDNSSKYNISVSARPQVSDDTKVLDSSNSPNYYIQNLLEQTENEELSSQYLLSDKVVEKLEDVDFVKYGDRYHNISLEKTGELGLDVDAELVDSSASFFDPAKIQMTLKTTENDSVVWSGAPPPFGVITAESRTENYISLWNPNYTQNEYVHTGLWKNIKIVNSIGIGTEISPDKTIQQNYMIYPYQGIAEGNYTVQETLQKQAKIYRPEIRYELQFEIR